MIALENEKGAGLGALCLGHGNVPVRKVLTAFDFLGPGAAQHAEGRGSSVRRTPV